MMACTLQNFRYVFLLLLLTAAIRCAPDKSSRTLQTQEPKDSTIIMSLVKRADTISWYQPDTAMMLLRKARALSDRSGFKRGIIKSLQSTGTLFMERGLYDSSLAYFEQALHHASGQEPGDTATNITLYSNSAAVYVSWGRYEDALQLQYKAMHMATGTRFSKLRCLIYNNIGSILYELGQTDKAFYYLDKGKDIAFRVKEANFILPYIYINEALLFLKDKKTEASKEKCRLAITADKQFQSTEVQYAVADLMGNIYKAENKPGQAIASYKSILDMKPDYPSGKLQALISLGNMYLELKQYPTALAYLQEAMQKAWILNGNRELKRIYEGLINVYRNQQRYALALDYEDKLMGIKDSLLDIEKVRSLSILEIKYQTAEKNKVIAENKLQIADQRARIVRKNIMIGGTLAGTALILSLSGFFYFYKQKLQRQKQETAIWHAMVEGEEKERARIAHDLHDGIGGLLSTLKMYLGILQKRVPAIAAIDVYRDATQLLDDTVTEVRKTAHNLMPELLLNHGLSEAVRIYCNAIQDDEGLKIDFQYYGFIGKLNSGFQLSLYRIIQELVQNILKHANASLALVQLSQHNEFLDITVEDNGIGMPEEKIKHGGIGLQSIKRRVSELQGNFHISSTPGNGTTIYIEFNLLQQKDQQA
jgi:signal transduction histidine kinase